MDIPILAGFIAAILHVITGPDHLAGVTSFAIEAKKKPWQVGMVWGLGHLSAMIMIGLLLAIFKEHIPIEIISTNSEFLVGILLIAVAIWGVIKFLNTQQEEENVSSPVSHKASFGVGMVHGLAGVGHVLLMLPALSFESFVASLAYVLSFGAGSLVAMSLYTHFLNVLTKRMQVTSSAISLNNVRLVGAVLTFLVGVVWISASFSGEGHHHHHHGLDHHHSHGIEHHHH